MQYDNSNQIDTGLWIKISQKGMKYYSGSIEIKGQKYWVKLFHVVSSNEKAPEFRLILDPADEKSYPNKPKYLDSHPASPLSNDDMEMPF